MTGKEAESNRRSSSRLRWPLAIALLLFALLVVIRSSMPHEIGELARQELLQRLRTNYPHLEVRIDRGHYQNGVGLIFEDLQIRDPKVRDGWRSRTLLRVDRLIVVADFSVTKMLQQDGCNPLDTRQIIVDGGALDVWGSPPEGWSYSQLLPIPKFGPQCPVVDVRNFRLSVSDVGGGREPITAEITAGTIRTPCDLKATIDQRIRLTLTSQFAKRIGVDLHVTQDRIAVSTKVHQFKWQQELLDRLPMPWATQLAELSGLTCLADIELRAERLTGQDWNHFADVDVRQGRLLHPRLPMPITEIAGRFRSDVSGIHLQSFQCRLREAICRIDGTVGVRDWPRGTGLRIRTEGLMINESLSTAMPEAIQTLWQRVMLNGRVDVDARIAHVEGRWKTDADVLCRGVDLQFDKFPFPVKQLTGRIRVENENAYCELLEGRAGDRSFRCNFILPARPRRDGESDLPMQFACNTDGPVLIDEMLTSSLTPRGEPTTGLESFVRSLSPSGSIQVTSAVVYREAGGPLRRSIDLQVVDGGLRYRQFQYPLFNVHGGIRVRDDLIEIDRFSGNTPSSGLVRCSGSYKMPEPARGSTPLPVTFRLPPGSDDRTEQAARPSTGSPPSELKLVFNAYDLPMDKALRSSLPAASQRTWDAISPSGIVDNVDVTIQRTGNEPLRLTLAAKQKTVTRVESRNLSLRPPTLPYRLDITGGLVRYDGQRVVIESLQGRHGESNLSANGICTADANGRWELELDILGGSRLLPDAELISSLPAPMVQTMRQLQLRGPVGVRGKTSIRLADDTNPQPVIQWDITMQLEGNRIGDVGPVHSLRGEIYSVGRHDGQQLLAAGRIYLDSMHIHEMQLTNLRGPFAIQDDTLRMGEAAQAGQTISGTLFSGTLSIDGTAELSDSEFDVEMTLQKAAVPTLLAELGQPDQGLTGTINATARLNGVLGDFHQTEGSGQARMIGANIYQLPLVIQIFNQLRITASEDVAITDGDCEFTLDGQDVIFQRLRLWGDLVALYGGGRVIRGRDLDLSFDTRVSPQNVFTRAIGPMRETPYALWTIDVTGPIGNQTIQRRALDNLGNTLDMLFPGRQEADDFTATSPASTAATDRTRTKSAPMSTRIR